MKTNVFRTIKFKITVAFVAITLLGTVFLAWKLYSIASSELTDSVKSNFKSITSQAVTEIQKENEKQFLMLEKLSQLPNICDPDISFEEKDLFLREIAKKDSRYTQITFFAENGDNYTELRTYINCKGRPFFDASIVGNNYILDPAVNPVTGAMSMYYSMPVKTAQGKIIGVIILILDGRVLCEVVNKLPIGTDYPMIVNNKTGLVVGESNIELVKKATNLTETAHGDMKMIIEDVMRGGSDYKMITDKRNGANTKKICCYTPIPGCDWSIIALGNYDEFFDGLGTMLRASVFASAASVLISIVIAIFLTVHFLKPLGAINGAIKEIASGNADLTHRLEVKSEDEVGSVASGFNQFMQKLHDIMSSLKNQEEHLDSAENMLHSAAQDTTNNVKEIINHIEGVSSQITNQAASVEETSGTINEISDNINKLDDMIEDQVNSVSQASAAVEQMIGNISSVNQNVENMAGSFAALISDTETGMKKQDDVNERIKKIEEQSAMLQEANEAIANIAAQTNLLAMNAAIEAAHAGDAGKGFSVVADEIRKLSETSTSQSKTIGDQLTNIRDSIETVVNSSIETREAFTSVSKRIEETDSLVQQIKSAMAEQQEGSKQIGDSLHLMNDSALDVKSAAEEMTEGSKAIVEEMNRLRDETVVMKSSVDEMGVGAKTIDQTAAALNEIVIAVNDVMGKIKGEIGQFTV